MSFKICYILFFISALLLGAVMVGPLSVRNIATVMMFVVCLKYGAVQIDKYFRVYLIFIAFYVISCMFSGYLQDALTKCVAYYFVCFVGYQATKLLIKKYDGLNWLAYSLLLIGVLDATLTLMQSIGVPFAFVPFESIRPKDISDGLLSYYDRTGSMSGVVLPGLVGGVHNGYLLSALCALGFYRIRGKFSAINYILIGIFFMAVIAVQERSGILVGITLIIYIFMRGAGSKNKYITIIIFTIVCICAYPMISDMLFHENSRFTDLSFENDVRSDFLSYVQTYMSSNPMGGIYDYEKIYGFPPHNLFLNALVYAGILGFPFFLALFFMQMRVIIPIALKRMTTANSPLIIFALMYVADTTNSLVHNSSLITGSLTLWIYWGAVVAFKDKSVEVSK